MPWSVAQARQAERRETSTPGRVCAARTQFAPPPAIIDWTPPQARNRGRFCIKLDESLRIAARLGRPAEFPQALILAMIFRRPPVPRRRPRGGTANFLKLYLKFDLPCFEPLPRLRRQIGMNPRGVVMSRSIIHPLLWHRFGARRRALRHRGLRQSAVSVRPAADVRIRRSRPRRGTPTKAPSSPTASAARSSNIRPARPPAR